MITDEDIQNDYLQGTILLAEVVGATLQPKQKVLDAIKTIAIYNDSVKKLSAYISDNKDFDFAQSIETKPAGKNNLLASRIIAFINCDKRRESGATMSTIMNRLRVPEPVLELAIGALVSKGVLKAITTSTTYNNKPVVRFVMGDPASKPHC